MDGAEPRRERRAGIAGGELEQLAVGGGREVGRRGRFPRPVGGEGRLSRSVRVMPRSRSPLPVRVQRHWDLVVPLSTPPTCALSVLVMRASGSSRVAGPISARPSTCSSSTLPVADTFPRTVRLIGRRAAQVALAADEDRAWSCCFVVPYRLRRIDQDVALILGQYGVAFGVQIVGRAAVALDQEPGDVGVSAGIAAVGRDTGADLRGRRAETLAQDDVHDLLVRAIAVFQSDFLGQDLDPLDRSVGMSRSSRKPEMRWPLSSDTGCSPPGPARCRSAGASACNNSLMFVAPVARTSRASRVFSGGMSPTTEPRAVGAGDDDFFLVAFIVGSVAGTAAGAVRRAAARGPRVPPMRQALAEHPAPAQE